MQIIAMAADSHFAGGESCGTAAAHVVADFLRLKEAYEIFDQFWGAISPVFIVAAFSTFGIGDDTGQRTARRKI